MTDELEDLKKYFGNKHSSEDVVTASQVGRLAGTLMVDHPSPNKGDPVPPGYHGVFFPGLAPLSNIRTDGQPKSGGGDHHPRYHFNAERHQSHRGTGFPQPCHGRPRRDVAGAGVADRSDVEQNL